MRSQNYLKPGPYAIEIECDSGKKEAVARSRNNKAMQSRNRKSNQKNQKRSSIEILC